MVQITEFALGLEQRYLGVQGVNTTAILKAIDHRPYPLSRGPWIMTQIWHQLLFAHWPIAPIRHSLPGTLEYWLTERYCLYTVVDHTHLYRADIHHRRWPLQVAELETTRDTMATAHGIRLPDIPPLLHYAHRQEVLVWPLRRISEN